MSHLPVDPRDFPDPFVLNTDAGFYAYATNGGGSNVQVLTSPDLVTWDGAADALPALAAWAQRGNTWAPCVLPGNGAYVMFYACREPKAGRQAISVATSAHPGGPFTDTSSGPLVYQLDLGGSIDPSPFVDADGTAYLVWKADSNAINQPSSIWLQPIGPNSTTLTGAPTELLGYGAPWENPLIEAPSIVRAGSTYFLFYSANWWNTDRYSIGYATATAVGGPYTKDHHIQGLVRLRRRGGRPRRSGMVHGLNRSTADGVPRVDTGPRRLSRWCPQPAPGHRRPHRSGTSGLLDT